MSLLGSASRGPAGRFLDWWSGELAGLLPGRRARSRATRGRWIVLAQGGDGPRLIEENGRRARSLVDAGDASGRESAVAAALDGIAGRERRPPIAVRLPLSACYARTLNLPAAARADLGRILALDLERSTPFKAGDVLVAHHVLDAPPAPGRIAVRQLVVKRAQIAEAMRPLERAGLAPDRVDCWDETGERALPVDFLAAPEPATAPARTAPRLLALAAVALALVAALGHASRQEDALAALEAERARARGELAALQAGERHRDAAASDLAELAALARAEVSRALVVDALTALLPDSDHLTGLRIEGSEIEVQGFSASAAALVPLIERSEMFSGAVLTAPVTFDARVGKERFALKATIRARIEQRATLPLERGAG